MREVFEGNYQVYPDALQKVTARTLNSAVDSAFKGKKSVLEHNLIDQLKFQNEIFSAFKAKDAAVTLERLKKASKATSFSAYKEAALPHANKYQINYLKAEYATAKRSMQSARQYARAMDDSDLYPYIKYMPSRSESPRDSHKVYYNIVRPVTDSFWKSHLPPLDWRCDCWWKTVKSGETEIPKNLPKPAAGLDNNPAVSGQVFSGSHPYFKGLDNKVKSKVIKRTVAGIAKKDMDAITIFKPNLESNGCYFSFGDAKKVAYELKEANKVPTTYLTKKGRMVELLERVEKDGVASVDAKVNDHYAEFKACSSRNSIQKQMRKANRQFRNLELDGDLYLFNTKGMSLQDIYRAIKGRVKETPNIKRVYIIVDGKTLYQYDSIKKGMTEIIP